MINVREQQTTFAKGTCLMTPVGMSRTDSPVHQEAVDSSNGALKFTKGAGLHKKVGKTSCCKKCKYQWEEINYHKERLEKILA